MDDQTRYFEELMERLRKEVNVFRTALRLDSPEEQYPVVAESLGDDAETTKGPLPYDLTQQGTVQYMLTERRILVQPDCYKGPRPPQQLMDEEHVGAQLLGPLFEGDRLTGIVAAHHQGDPREWTADNVASMAWAVDCVRQRLRADNAAS